MATRKPAAEADRVSTKVELPEAPEIIPPERAVALVGGGFARPGFLIPQTLAELNEIAETVVAMGEVPRSFMDKETGLPNIAKIKVSIMAGLELEITPMKALQIMAVINGIPVVYGDGALGLIFRSGYLVDIEEGYGGSEQDGSFYAFCRVTRKGKPTPVERQFSWQQAVLAKLHQKAGPWQEHPRRMLQMRARSFALRDTFPDVLGGFKLYEDFDVDEDYIRMADGTYGPAAPPPRPRRPDAPLRVVDPSPPNGRVTDVEEEPAGAAQASHDEGRDAGDPGPGAEQAPAQDLYAFVDEVGEQRDIDGAAAFAAEFNRVANLAGLSDEQRINVFDVNSDEIKRALGVLASQEPFRAGFERVALARKAKEERSKPKPAASPSPAQAPSPAPAQEADPLARWKIAREEVPMMPDGTTKNWTKYFATVSTRIREWMEQGAPVAVFKRYRQVNDDFREFRANMKSWVTRLDGLLTKAEQGGK